MALIPKRFATFFSIPIFRRAAFHVKRLTGGLDSSFFVRVGIVLAGFLLIASALVTLAEREREGHTWTRSRVPQPVHGLALLVAHHVMGAGDSSQVHTPDRLRVQLAAHPVRRRHRRSLTGALVGFLIDYLLKEGQGMGASGYRDHIIVCGWNATARELIQELSTDEYTTKIVVIHDADKNPAGDGVYFVSGDITTAHDLKRAGIEDARRRWSARRTAPTRRT
jgi:voltage-gated potassium channel